MNDSSCANCSWRRLALRPDLLAVHRVDPGRYPFLLESVDRGSERARYDLLFAYPGARLALAPEGTLTSNGADAGGNDFLERLDDWMASVGRPMDPAPTLPFFGGWFVYLGYELVAQTEAMAPALGPRQTALWKRYLARAAATELEGHVAKNPEDPQLTSCWTPCPREQPCRLVIQ